MIYLMRYFYNKYIDLKEIYKNGNSTDNENNTSIEKYLEELKILEKYLEKFLKIVQINFLMNQK